MAPAPHDADAAALDGLLHTQDARERAHRYLDIARKYTRELPALLPAHAHIVCAFLASQQVRPPAPRDGSPARDPSAGDARPVGPPPFWDALHTEWMAPWCRRRQGVRCSPCPATDPSDAIARAAPASCRVAFSLQGIQGIVYAPFRVQPEPQENSHKYCVSFLDIFLEGNSCP